MMFIALIPDPMCVCAHALAASFDQHNSALHNSPRADNWVPG